ncbi:hypothetical protein COEREDRAFT_79584 [Coemansia reversa NRRL 1564]|uniref:Uncharacterized protein n=1 Tax=Coemansia reversa (strain ATCC 12441 / NRRL 1564) TaxID=763665 RepID=A0A2G5BHS8_COERN|nr:hypothetical protein COEREDRAFT_79584 [Coemansia reversa NRRL 1564]|eukprot:PIA18532.1 hypothetical protein COEREDRAFT_79584 [Coemansia reversa NRRL 1564]
MASSVVVTAMTNGASTADARNHIKHTMGDNHQISGEVEATFSPLSSSTITIASLGSSLGYGNNKRSDAGTRSPVRRGIGSHALSKGADAIDSDEEATTDDGNGGGFGTASTSGASSHICVKGTRDMGLREMSANSQSYSSANPSSTAGSPSSPSSRNSVELPHVAMRSVSVDYARAYGLQMLPSDTQTALSNAVAHDTAVMGKVDVQSAGLTHPQVASQIITDTHKSPQAAQLGGFAGAARRTALSFVRATSAPRRTRPHRSLTQRLLHPLSHKQIAGSNEDSGVSKRGAASEIDRRIVLTTEQSQGGGETSESNRRQHAETRISVSSARNGNSSHVSAQLSDGIASASISTPIVDEAVLNTADSINVFPSSGIPSRSLEIKNTEGLLTRAPLSRRTIQRTKREDAIYGSAGDANEVYGKDKSVIGPARFQGLPRSLVSRLGFSNLLAERRRPGDLRFVIAPHARLSEVIEVFDCEEMVAVYRKVSRSGKSWHETFHAVDAKAEAEAEAAAVAAAGAAFLHYPGIGNSNRMLSDYEMASALGLPYPGIGVANPYGSPGNTQSMFGLAATASCMTFQSSSSSAGHGQAGIRAIAGAYGSDIQIFDDSVALTNSSSASFTNMAAGTARMARASTSMGYALGGRRKTIAASIYGRAAGVGVPFDKALLWEALTPFPNQFPLHIKDSRTIIDTVSLSSMVLDRNNFCYRFQLGTNRMRWVAKRARKNQLALQCFVRNSLVAEVFVDYEKGYSPYNMMAPQRPSAETNGTSGTAVARGGRFGDSNTTSGISTPIEAFSGSEGISASAVGSSSSVHLPEDGSLPLLTILPIAFDQLACYEEDVVESFIIFTGMQMLECLHI